MDYKIWCLCNNRTAIEFLNQNKEVEIKATTNIPDVPLNKNEIIIKNYEENSGIYENMLELGYIGPVLRYARVGWVNVPIVELLLKPSIL